MSLIEFDNRPHTYHATDKVGKESYNPFTKKKDYDYYKDWANRFISAFNSGAEFEHKNYKKYRGVRDKQEFDRIIGMYGDMAMPVPDIPHVPLIRRYIDHLVSVNRLRPFVFNILYNDPDAVKAKDEELTKSITKEVIDAMMRSLQQEMQGQDPQQAQGEMQQRVKQVTENIGNFRTIQEKAADKTLRTAIERLNLREKLSAAFLDKLITGKEFYRCKLNRIGELPEFEIINPTDIAFSAEDVDSLNECTFVVHRKWMSFVDVYTRYGHYFTEQDKNFLRTWEQTWNIATTEGQAIPNYIPTYDKEFGYIGSTERNLIEVFEIEWKENEMLPVIELDGKLEILSEDAVLEGGYDESKIKYKYYQTLHTCTRINNNIYVKWGKVKYARRNPNDISKVLLSYNGKLYNNRNNPPLSLVKELGDLQDRYDIVWYKLLEMLMLSGNKGAVLIEELLPPDMTPEEWMYWRKLGIARLSVSQEGINPELINQIGQTMTAYDDTLSANGLQSAIALINQIEKTVGDICGVPPQALGQTQQYETKANAELSVTQGTITTEKIHQHHQEFCKEALNDVLHWSKVGLSKGHLRDYILTPVEQKAMKDLDFSWIDYNVMIVDGYREEKNLQNAKQMVAELVKSQAVAFDTLVKSLGTNSLNELDVIVTNAIKNMQERQQQSQQAELQAKQQETQAKIELEKAKMTQQSQLEQAKLQQDSTKLVEEIKIKEEEVAIKDRLATVEEKYVEIAERELQSGIDTANRKLDSREGRNKK